MLNLRMSKYIKKFGMHSLVVILCIGLLAISGCTKQTSGPSDTGKTTGSTSASSSGDIPIGILTSYTGEMGAFGKPVYNAAKLAVDQINAAGGVNGRKIMLYTEDDQSTVESGIRGARKLITANGVIAMHGMISDVLLAIWDFAKQNKVFIASPYAGTTKLDKIGGDYQLRTVPSDSLDGKVAAQSLWDKGYRKIAIMFETAESTTSIGNAVKEQFEKLGGSVTMILPFQSRQSSYLAELKKVADTNPEAVWLGTGQETAPTILKQCKQRDYKWQWMVSSDVAVPEIFKLVGKDIMNGILTEIPAGDNTSEDYKKFSSEYKATFGKEPGGNFEANSYDAMMIMALAIQAGGKADGTTINQNYKKVASPPGVKVHSYKDAFAELKKGNDIDYEGPSGDCNFDDHGTTSGSFNALIAKDGQWEQFKFYPASTFEN
ncbi:ABC transporter substrate-binding protein [Desulfosporosinus metallidurans]|nr:ABC transporter substrate-binding protein [Desulfosporosinus metallidurans]